jgi:hypothetical protein
MRARDLRGMAADQCLAWRRTGDRKLAVCSTFGVRSAADLPCRIGAGGRREAGGRMRLCCQQKIPICRMFSTGATGLEPATSGVTGRHGATGHDRLRPGITGYSRHFVDSRAGSDLLRPATTRHSLCGRCVVRVMPGSTTIVKPAVSDRMTDPRNSGRDRVPDACETEGLIDVR